MTESGEVREAVELAPYPESGARIIQLTNSDAVFDNIYSEVAYMDASSRWFMINKSADRTAGAGTGPTEVWRCDLKERSLTLVTGGVAGTLGMAVSPDTPARGSA